MQCCKAQENGQFVREVSKELIQRWPIPTQESKSSIDKNVQLISNHQYNILVDEYVPFVAIAIFNKI